MRWISLFFVGILFAFSGTAWGQSCSVTTNPANFGNYDTTASAPQDTVAGIGINCDAGVAYNIKLDAGQHSTGDFNRSMRSLAGDSNLNYNLYIDSARTEVWGDGTGNTSTRSGTGTGGPNQFNAYGRIPGRQNVKADFYNDSVIVTVEW